MQAASDPPAWPPGHYWSRLRCVVWAVLPAWPALLIVLIYALLLFGADQVQDVALGAVLDWTSLFGRALGLAAWNTLSGLSVWFAARLLVSQRHRLPPGLPQDFTQARVECATVPAALWLARGLGVAVPLLTAAAFLLAGRHALHHAHAAPAADAVLAAAAVAAIAWSRRSVVRTMGAAFAGLRPRAAMGAWCAPREVGRPTVVVGLTWLAAALGGMVWAVDDPVAMGQVLGPFNVLCIGLTGLCFGLTALAFLQRALNIPAFALAALLAVVSAYTGDNHTLPRIRDAAVPPSRTLAEAYAGFIAPPGPHRLLLVATAGGGIRAAFWTAYVLGKLHDAHGPAFDRALFAVSGVSGGGVGAVFYRAMLAEQEHGLPTCTRPDGTQHASFAECAEHYLGQDGIGPALAGLLFPDLAQRFLPWPWLPDRAAALSAAWSAAWAKDARTAGGYMAGPFAALWRPERPWPVLLLNGTSVAQGHRILTSNLDFTRLPDAFHDVQAFPATYVVSAATAGLNTARFPLVSPPGGIPAQDGRPADQIVDGGVFENSGAQTTIELLQWILGQPAASRPAIAILQITSDPEQAAGPSGACAPGAPPAGTARAPRLLPDLTSGLTALVRSRGARGTAEMAALREEACQGGFPYAAIRMPALDDRPDPPLGWTLSGAAIAAIKAGWPSTDASAPDGANGAAVRSLTAWLQGG